MIDHAISIVGLYNPDSHVKIHDIPAVNVLHSDPSSKPTFQKWYYRSTVGYLSYIQTTVCPDITFAVQQCTWCCKKPSSDQEEAVKWICRYLLSTRDKGLTLKLIKSKGLECYVDADWARSWNLPSSLHPISTRSRAGFVITHTGCPIL